MNSGTFYYFGCSFTDLESSLTGYEFVPFRKLIQERVSCNSKNYSQTGLSNPHIFDKVYNAFKNNSIDKKTDWFIIQTTFLYRLGIQCDISNDFVSICKRENPENQIEKIQIDFYNDWLKNFYSPVLELKEFEKQVDLLAGWLKNNEINFVFIGMDELINELSSDFFKRNKFIEFDENEFAFYPFATKNKYRIADIIYEKDATPDFHFNRNGHKFLTDKILQTINP